MAKKGTNLKTPSALAECGRDVLSVIVPFLDDYETPFCARVCSLWLCLFTKNNPEKLRFGCVQSHDQHVYVAQFPPMWRHSRMYKCIGLFGSMQDVHNLTHSVSIDAVPDSVLVLIVVNAMRNSRFTFMTELWTFCADKQKSVFSQGIVGAIFSDDVQVFEWLIAHHVAPHATDKVMVDLALFNKKFNFLNWIHDLALKCRDFAALHADTPESWLALMHWRSMYDYQRGLSPLAYDEDAIKWLLEHPI